MLIGRLGKDPNIQNFDSGTVKASFPLATDESYVDRNGNKVELTEWHNIVMWRGLATIAEKYLKKGSLIYIEGKLKTRSWDDKEGHKRYITEIEANDLSMLSSRPTTDHSSDSTTQNATDNSKTLTSKQFLSDDKDADSDLPF